MKSVKPMSNIPDHPVIRNMEQTGYPDGKEPEIPICPMCGQEADDIYRNTDNGEIVGCDNCIERLSAWYALETEEF